MKKYMRLRNGLLEEETGLTISNLELIYTSSPRRSHTHKSMGRIKKTLIGEKDQGTMRLIYHYGILWEFRDSLNSGLV